VKALCSIVQNKTKEATLYTSKQLPKSQPFTAVKLGISNKGYRI
jgi:hypothetical protein